MKYLIKLSLRAHALRAHKLVDHYGFGQQGGKKHLELKHLELKLSMVLVNKGVPNALRAHASLVDHYGFGQLGLEIAKRVGQQGGKTLKVLLGFPLLTIPFSDFRLSPYLTIPFSDFRLSPLLTNPFSDFPRVDQNHSGQQGAGVRTQCIRYFPETV